MTVQVLSLTSYAVGHNIPGYLPDDPESVYITFVLEEAWAALLEDVKGFVNEVATELDGKDAGIARANDEIVAELEAIVAPEPITVLLRDERGGQVVFWLDAATE